MRETEGHWWLRLTGGLIVEIPSALWGFLGREITVGRTNKVFLAGSPIARSAEPCGS